MVVVATTGLHGAREAIGQAVWSRSGLTVERADGDAVLVRADDRGDTDPSARAGFRPDRRVAGMPAQWRTENPKGLWLLTGSAPFNLFIGGVDVNHADWLDADEAVWFAEHIQASRDLNDPASRPR
ncbi:hypothetical protein Drose_18780 [Dactylosporangium roseum]|uniref:Uncharacterized protein n=1 Tax=Dactylosporangium roseum TaxID=47989 RepID=A0ABY5ZD47_9ACTN|nr:hypothetical protein [Dactylosporangium roseum]UWZ40060.1 hypothetical protein Drose_18780 [Dactylosporangium roseum]